jgi:hypothetical protein
MIGELNQLPESGTVIVHSEALQEFGLEMNLADNKESNADPAELTRQGMVRALLAQGREWNFSRIVDQFNELAQSVVRELPQSGDSDK